jgi:hypothetical protein
MKPTDKDLQILRVVSISGIVTAGEIEKSFPMIEGARNSLECMFDFGYLMREHLPGKAAIYELSQKGRRLLNKPASREMGDMPAPRSFVPQGAYVPSKIITRPGSDAFLKLPSLIGSQSVPYRGGSRNA